LKQVTLLLSKQDQFDYALRPVASARHVARRRVLRLRRTSGCLGSSSTTSTTPRVRLPRHVVRLVAPLVADYFAYAVRPGASARRVTRHAARRRLLRLCRASWCLCTSRGSSRGWSRLVVDYFAYAARPGASVRRATRHAARRAAHRRLLRICRASGCLGTSRGSSRRSSSTTSPTPRVRVPRHVARLVVDYFGYAARPGASTHRTACITARRRLLRVRRASGCLGTSCGSSRGSSSTTSTTPRVRVPRHVTRLVVWLIIDYFASRRLVVDYFTYAARPVASARRTACRVTHRRLLLLAQARRRLFRLHRASGCLGTSHGSSHSSSLTTSPRAGSSSNTSPMPRVRFLRHVARLVMRLIINYFASRRLVVDYFTYATRPGALTHRATRHAACRRLLRLRRASGCLGTSRGSSLTTLPPPRVRVLRYIARLVAWLVVDYFDYAARLVASARRAAHRAACLSARRGLLRLAQLVVDYFTYVARPVSSARRAACRVTHRRLLHLA
jgi:hypothetical protein